MRDKNRIRPFLHELAECWEEYPDLRFGQLVEILSEKLSIDPFFAEENRWEQVIKSLKRGD
jgi:hypothetical protein